MKKILYLYLILPLFTQSMEQQTDVASLRSLCLDKIVDYLQTDQRFTAACVAHLPLDLASSLWEKIQDQMAKSQFIAKLSAQAKISPDGTKLLVDSDYLKVYDSTTATYMFSLEDSLTSDGKEASFSDNRRFIPIKWSSTGKYIYANFSVPKNDFQDPTRYLYKIWESATGKKLYEVPFRPCGKLYFSPQDHFLLSKLSDEPLQVYHAATGIHAATLGPQTGGYFHNCHDPQNQWLTVYNNSQDATELYDTQQFALAKKLDGRLEYFSADGTLMAVKIEEDTGQTQESLDFDGLSLYPNRRQVTIPYASIYNRHFESLAKIPLKRYGHRMAISPNHQFLIFYDGQGERRYSLATLHETQKLDHHFDRDRHPISIFSTFAGDGTIQLENKGESTQITIERDGIKKQIICPAPVRTVFYTENAALVALEYHHTIRYLLNIKTGTLIPCNISVSMRLFSYKPTKAVSHGYFITEGDKGFELRKLTIPDKLFPCIQLLTEKLKVSKTAQGKLT